MGYSSFLWHLPWCGGQRSPGEDEPVTTPRHRRARLGADPGTYRQQRDARWLGPGDAPIDRRGWL